MKKKWILLVLAGLLSIIFSITRGWAGDLEIIDLLKQKGILTEEEYTNIRAQFDKEQQKQLKPVYKDGFKLETGDKEFSLGFEGRIYADGRYYLNDEDPNNSSFVMRTVRATLKGTLYKYYNFKVEGDWGDGKTELKDAYIEANYVPWLVFRAGQFKEPFNLEENTSSRYSDFVERSMVNNLVPSRDIGFMLYGTLLDDRINYGIGGFNGNGSNKSTDSSDDKDVAARVVLSPFLLHEGSIFQNLHIGGAVTHGYQDKFDSDWSVRNEARNTFFKISTADKINVDTRTRLDAELAYTYGPFSLKGEYVNTSFTNIEKAGSKVEDDMDINAWYVTAGYFLTGEEKAWKNGVFTRTKPKQNFSPFKGGGTGAWELLFRYSRFDADEDFIKKGIVKAGSYTDEADSYTVGLNWYINPMVVMKLNWVHTKYDDDLPGKNGKTFDDENAIMTRFQIEF